MQLKELGADLLRHSRYVWAAVLVFAVSLYMGFANADQFMNYMRAQIEGIQGIVENIQGKDHFQWWLFAVIFLNNAIKTVLVVLAGALLGLPPIVFLVINGLLLGFLFANKSPHVTYGDMLLAIVPHGIIEIPALLLGAAYGIRLGWLILQFMISLAVPGRRKQAVADLKEFFERLPALIAVLIGALLLAAVVESTLTFALVSR